MPPAQIAARGRAVAVGPEYESMVESASTFPKSKLAYFGTVKSRLSWGPLDGNTAVIRDCMDQTKFGTYRLGTNKAITVGSERVNLHATFERTSAGWRVAGIFEDEAEGC